MIIIKIIIIISLFESAFQQWRKKKTINLVWMENASLIQRLNANYFSIKTSILLNKRAVKKKSRQQSSVQAVT